MVKTDKRVGTEGNYPIQGLHGNCSAATMCKEEKAVLRPIIGAAGAVLLKAKNAQMSAVQYLVGLSLFLG